MSDVVGVGVLVSGRGTNLRALAQAQSAAGFPARIALVISNRAGAGAVAVAREAGLDVSVMPLADYGGDTATRDRAMVAALRERGVRLVVLAGYDRVLSQEFLDAFPDAILNVHPSLLPAFGGGMNAVEMALEAGVRVTGCTVHLLQPGATDSGPIVLQMAVPVLDGDDAERLRDRIHQQEWRLLPEAVALWAAGRLRRSGHHIEIIAAGTSAGVVTA